MIRIPLLLLVAALSCTACMTTPAPSAARQVAANTAFPMAVGETVLLPAGTRLTYVRVRNDSRCPSDVQCIWAGDATIELTARPQAGTTQTIELHTGIEPRSQAIGAGTLTLQSLQRGTAPVATLRFVANDAR